MPGPALSLFKFNNKHDLLAMESCSFGAAPQNAEIEIEIERLRLGLGLGFGFGIGLGLGLGLGLGSRSFRCLPAA